MRGRDFVGVWLFGLSITGWSEVSVISVWGVCEACQGSPRARMYASHSIAQNKATPLMFAAKNESAQSPALVELLLKAKAEANARNSVSTWERDGTGRHKYGVTGR